MVTCQVSGSDAARFTGTTDTGVRGVGNSKSRTLTWQDRRDKAGIAYRIGVGLLATVAIVLQLLIGFTIINAAGLATGFAVALVVLLGIAAARDNFRVVKARIADRRSGSELSESLWRYCCGTLLEAETETGVPFRDMGVSIFRVTTLPPVVGTEYLVREVRFRLEAPQPADIDWTLGKGAIGRAWALRKRQHCDWQPIARRWGQMSTVPEADWAGLTEEQRWGFSRDEFRTMSGKYAEILAVPINHPKTGAIMGCMALDRKMDYEAPDGLVLFASPSMEAILSGIAGLVARAWTRS